MKEVLKHYQMELVVKGPVFVGSGKEIGKKEYVFLDAQTLGILAPEKLYAELRHRGKSRQFEEYLLNNRRDDLTNWLRNENVRVNDIKDCIRYSLKCRELIEARKEKSKLQIMECTKDPYGKPYIPGSSIKGMLRTIILGNDILENPEMYSEVKHEMTRELFSNGKVDRKWVLRSPMNRIEEICYRTLARPESKSNDAVNDIMQGFIVSDSEPLELEDLTLAQAIELHTDGTEKTLPILRESIKPGTRIRFTLTIDTKTCPLDSDYLMYAVSRFAEQMNTNFGKAFSGIDRMQRQQVVLGGGGGFLSKTIIYPLYGKQKGLGTTQQIFEKTGVPKEHKHIMDKRYGVSPHIMKTTRYQGKLCKMGLCDLNVIEP